LPSTRAQAEGLRVDPEPRSFTPSSKPGLNVAERVNRDLNPEQRSSRHLKELHDISRSFTKIFSDFSQNDVGNVFFALHRKETNVPFLLHGLLKS